MRCERTAVDCDDGNACTLDRCDPNTGKCVHEEKVCLCVAGNVQKCAPDSGECQHQPVCKADAECGRRCGPTMMTRACATCA